MYHQGNRDLQDRFGSRALADRLESAVRRERFTEEDAAFIAAQTCFFLATADAEGRPDCSYKGGAPGLVRALEPEAAGQRTGEPQFRRSAVGGHPRRPGPSHYLL